MGIAVANLILAGPLTANAAVQAAEQGVAAAVRDYGEGRAVTARRALEALVDSAEARDPMSRLKAVETLLDVCLRTEASACVATYTPKYVEAAEAVAAAFPQFRQELALRAAYHVDHGRYLLGEADDLAEILEGELWRRESGDMALELRRRVLAAAILDRLDRHAEAARALDRAMAIAAGLTNPQDHRLVLATALTDAFVVLSDLGEVERAYGLYRASGRMIARTLPAVSLDAVRFRLVEAQLLQAMGDLKGAGAALDAATDALGKIELEPQAREPALAAALTLKAVNCVAEGRFDCAGEALAGHPFAALHAKPGRRPQSFEELTYLAARGLVAAVRQQPDPIAAAALKAPVALSVSPNLGDMVEVYRLAGAGLAQPPGRARQDRLAAAGERLAAAARRRPPGAFASWYRPGLVDHMLIALTLTQADRPGFKAAETTFALAQLDGRRGPLRDPDALTALAQARDANERRLVHNALRLRTHRDRTERDILKAVAERALAQSPSGAMAIANPDVRGPLDRAAALIAEAEAELRGGPVSASGANIVSLSKLQALLKPDEAALAIATVPGGSAYLCVRRDSVFRRVAPLDLQQVRLDSRIVQAALAAGHAPSEALDSQFPAEAAVRLYDALIRPFGDCLRPGDHILWLPGVALTPVPLAALLERAPPKLGEGYDLAAADWLARRHSVSYAGSAAMIVAARTSPSAATAELDFMGVGDPVMKGPTPTGEERAAILARGARDAPDLAPLPETRPELERSAGGFQRTRLLMGEEATERRFRTEPIGKYRFLSFATHGLLREELDGLTEPALVLTPVTGADPQDDGLLTASEIADLRLAARFVALSACNTANYDMAQLAADLPALTSAFAIAGAPSTLATLWAVDSETSKQVVAEVFTRLAKDGNADPARVLAAAQRAFLASPPDRARLHPRFWAPFVVLGDGAAR